jgi:hypothetical protein
MEPNTKLFIKELMKEVRNEIHSLQVEMKDNFVTPEVSLNTRISELATTTQKQEEWVTGLETATANADKVLTSWKSEVDSSLSTIKLELTKFNTFFTRKGKTLDTSSPGVLTGGSASTRSSPGPAAAGPNGHRVDTPHQDCGFGSVYTHTHDPVKGTIYTPSPPNFLEFSAGHESHKFTTNSSLATCNHTGKLHKMIFLKFEGENPQLWNSRCENYFKMYEVEQEVWVRIATMHFEGPAARWL